MSNFPGVSLLCVPFIFLITPFCLFICVFVHLLDCSFIHSGTGDGTQDSLHATPAHPEASYNLVLENLLWSNGFQPHRRCRARGWAAQLCEIEPGLQLPERMSEPCLSTLKVSQTGGMAAGPKQGQLPARGQPHVSPATEGSVEAVFPHTSQGEVKRFYHLLLTEPGARRQTR